jgi:AraC-like DNA-binding protein/mannose-6-phosphate isomerase-like protein (cupin superfamily)
MRTLYTNQNIHLLIEQVELYVLNIVFERFSQRIPRHSHGNSSYEIHYIPYGRGTVIVDGNSFHITPGTLYVTGPHVEHEQIPEVENPMAEYCLYVKIMDEVCADKSDTIKLFRATTFWFGQDSQDIHACILLIFQELEKEQTGYMTQVESLLQQCIIKLVRNYESNKTSKSHFAPFNIADRKYIITEEYFLYDYQTLSLETLARKLGLSVRQTNRFLIKCYGKNFSQKKAEAKMSVAAVLLNDNSYKITDIALKLGYSSQEHFAAAFKRYYGMSAREYKKRERN